MNPGSPYAPPGLRSLESAGRSGSASGRIARPRSVVGGAVVGVLPRRFRCSGRQAALRSGSAWHRGKPKPGCCWLRKPLPLRAQQQRRGGLTASLLPRDDKGLRTQHLSFDERTLQIRADLSQHTPADHGPHRRNPMTSRPGAEGRSLARAPEAARQYPIRPVPTTSLSRCSRA